MCSSSNEEFSSPAGSSLKGELPARVKIEIRASGQASGQVLPGEKYLALLPNPHSQLNGHPKRATVKIAAQPTRGRADPNGIQ